MKRLLLLVLLVDGCCSLRLSLRAPYATRSMRASYMRAAVELGDDSNFGSKIGS